MRFISVHYNLREAVRWPKDEYRQSLRNSKKGKSTYGLEMENFMKEVPFELNLIRWGEFL